MYKDYIAQNLVTNCELFWLPFSVYGPDENRPVIIPQRQIQRVRWQAADDGRDVAAPQRPDALFRGQFPKTVDNSRISGRVPKTERGFSNRYRVTVLELKN